MADNSLSGKGSDTDNGAFEGAIGISLGSGSVCVAVVGPHEDDAVIIPNEFGNRTTPSWVAFINDGALNDNATDEENLTDESKGEHNSHCDAWFEGCVLVGDAARDQAAANPANTIFGFKELIGRTYSEIFDTNAQRLVSPFEAFPFTLVRSADGKDNVLIEMKSSKRNGVTAQTHFMSPEDVLAILFRKLKSDAEAFLGKQVVKVVAAVPAYFNDAQCAAIRHALTTAGFTSVLRVMNEPTATAIAFGMGKKKKKTDPYRVLLCNAKADTDDAHTDERNILVIDCGAGSFDVSLLTVDECGIFEIKGTNYFLMAEEDGLALEGKRQQQQRRFVSGNAFDQRIAEYAEKQSRRMKTHHHRHHAHTAASNLFRDERIKKILSSSTEAALPLSLDVGNADDNSDDSELVITRARFEALCGDLFTLFAHQIDAVLQRFLPLPSANDDGGEEGRRAEVIHDVLLVGGASKMPRIEQIVTECLRNFNRHRCVGGTTDEEPPAVVIHRQGMTRKRHVLFHPEEAVAYGVAMQGKVAEQSAPWGFYDWTELTVGMETVVTKDGGEAADSSFLGDSDIAIVPSSCDDNRTALIKEGSTSKDSSDRPLPSSRAAVDDHHHNSADVVDVGSGSGSGDEGDLHQRVPCERVMAPVIRRSTILPARRSVLVATVKDNQAMVSIRVIEGERRTARACRERGVLVLGGLTLAPRGVTRVVVTFSIDCNGILTVAAAEVGREDTCKAHIVIPNDKGSRLSQAEIDAVLKDAHRWAAEDEARRPPVNAGTTSGCGCDDGPTLEEID